MILTVLTFVDAVFMYQNHFLKVIVLYSSFSFHLKSYEYRILLFEAGITYMLSEFLNITRTSREPRHAIRVLRFFFFYFVYTLSIVFLVRKVYNVNINFKEKYYEF